MVITDVKTKVLFCPFKETVADAARAIAGRDVLLVYVQTDEGITGMGVLTGLGVAHGSEIHIIDSVIRNALRPMLLGEDPIRIEMLWQKMYKGTTRFGRKGAAVRAISGVDIALWDLVGKKAGLPVYKLLGGNSDGRVKVYATGGFYNMENDMEKLVEEMKRYVEKGFKAVKMKVGRDAHNDVLRVKAVREAIGPEIDLLIDANEAWDLGTAYRFIKDIEKYDIYWIEEPLIPDDMDGYMQLTAKSPITVAAGENEYTKFGFKDLIVNKAVNVVQPDVTRVGGITEWMKVAHFAEAFCMPCVTHAVSEVHVSLCAAVSNAPMMEFFNSEQHLQTFMTALFLEPAGVREMKDGYVKASQAPGLGLKVDEALVEKYLVQPIY